MTRFIGRNSLLGTASALVLSFGVALAEEPAADAPLEDDTVGVGGETAQPPTLVEVGPADAVAINENDIGTAAQHLAGMTAGEIEGMEVFDQSGGRIGVVRMVAQSDSGGIYLIVSSEESTATMVPGDHAVPLPRFDYNEEAQALVMWDAYATSAATPDPYGTRTRLYTALSGDAEIPQISAEQYRVDTVADAEALDEEEDLAELEDEPVIQPAGEVIRDRTVDEIVGRDVIDRNREDIGDVEELGVDGEGELFLVIGLNDGILGIGESVRAVKMDAFEYSIADDAFVLMEASAEALEALPEYDADASGYTIIESDLDWAQFK